MAVRQVLKNVNGIRFIENSMQKSALYLSSYQSSRNFTCGKRVAPKKEVMRFVQECMCKAGTTTEDAAIMAHHLMYADYRGHLSHGINRLSKYVSEIYCKLINPAAKPDVVCNFKATALVSGNNALGQVVGKYCMDLAICKALEYGIGIVAAKCSNHYGIGGYYALMAIEQNMIGFTCSNASPLMSIPRSCKAALGTNPISLGMGGACDDQFVLDMSATATSLGKIELAMKKCEQIPSNWALGPDGEPTKDPKLAINTARLLPLGGTDEEGGYKGYGLALMVEVLCGILSGSEYGPNIRRQKRKDSIANLGHCFIAINPEVIAPGAPERLTNLLQQLRELPRSGDKCVLVAGDVERMAMAKVDNEGGIEYHENMVKDVEEFAKKIGVQPMKLIPAKRQND